MRQIAFKAILSWAVCLLITNQIVAQNPNGNRARLDDRLRKLVELQRTHDYENLFVLMSSRSADSKDTFVKINQSLDALERPELLRFLPRQVYLVEPGNDWGIIVGCGEYVERGRKRRLESQVEAIYENDEWYFSSLITISSSFGQKPQKCSLVR